MEVIYILKNYAKIFAYLQIFTSMSRDAHHASSFAVLTYEKLRIKT